MVNATWQQRVGVISMGTIWLSNMGIPVVDDKVVWEFPLYIVKWLGITIVDDKTISIADDKVVRGFSYIVSVAIPILSDYVVCELS